MNAKTWLQVVGAMIILGGVVALSASSLGGSEGGRQLSRGQAPPPSETTSSAQPGPGPAVPSGNPLLPLLGVTLVGGGLGVLLWPHQNRLDRWIRGHIPHDVRKALVIGLAMLVTGLVSALRVAFESVGGQHTGSLAFLAGAVSLALTFGGLILAIYSIKGVLDRPVTIEDVLDRLTDIIDRIDKEEKASGRMGRERGLLLFMGEYPAIGALSTFRDRTESARDVDLGDWDGWLRNRYHTQLMKRYGEFNDKEWRVTIVCPRSNGGAAAVRAEMDKKIEDYGRRNLFTDHEIEAAKNFNWGLIEERFKKLPNNRFQWLPPARAELPRYQVVVCGTYDDSMKIAAEEAVVFLALDSPAPFGPAAGLRANPPANPAAPPNPPAQRPQGRAKRVPIIAWQITDRETLDALVEEILKAGGKTSSQALFLRDGAP